MQAARQIQGTFQGDSVLSSQALKLVIHHGEHVPAARFHWLWNQFITKARDSPTPAHTPCTQVLRSCSVQTFPGARLLEPRETQREDWPRELASVHQPDLWEWEHCLALSTEPLPRLMGVKGGCHIHFRGH